MDLEKKWNYVQNLNSKTDWHRYYGEYSAAIDNLLERSDQGQVTTLGLPLLFLIRHSLEIAFKMNILELKKVSGTKIRVNLFKEHVLHKLHDEFEKQVLAIFKSKKIDEEIRQQFNTRNQDLKKFRKTFDQLDNWSFAFRYPVRSDGQTKSFRKGVEINISDIIPVYKETKTILKYTTDVIAESLSDK